MKTSKRFTNAVTKLYKAFHSGELDAWDCYKCAVGNICNNDGSWSSFIDGVYKHKERPTDKPLVSDYPKFTLNKTIIESGYSIYELSMIESVFLSVMPKYGRESKEHQFQGLQSVVKYLCELEGIPNVMDYTCLFETENNVSKNKLESVFV